MSKSILLTGATGFVGSVILEDLLRNGYEVVAVHRSALDATKQITYPSGQCRFIRADLTEEFDLPDGIDAIIHTAALANPSGPSLADYLSNNVQATSNLVNQAVRGGVKNFINFSSLSVYGQITGPEVDENTERVDVSPYGMSKYMAELVLQESVEEINSVSIRFPGILGKGTKGPWLMKVRNQILQNEPINIFNPNGLFNNAIHVNDVSRWVVSLLSKDLDGARSITAGAKDPITVQETMELLIDLSGSTSTVTSSQNSRGTFTISNERAISDYGYQPSSVDQIMRMLAEEDLADEDSGDAIPAQSRRDNNG